MGKDRIPTITSQERAIKLWIVFCPGDGLTSQVLWCHFSSVHDASLVWYGFIRVAKKNMLVCSWESYPRYRCLTGMDEKNKQNLFHAVKSWLVHPETSWHPWETQYACQSLPSKKIKKQGRILFSCKNWQTNIPLLKTVANDTPHPPATSTYIFFITAKKSHPMKHPRHGPK